MAGEGRTPQRVQRQRVKGWRMPPNTVYVGRPTKWGNPFRLCGDKCRRDVVRDFRQWVLGLLSDGTGYPLAELRGKDLACWCPLVDQDGSTVSCHADVLLELANGEERADD